VAAVTRPAFIEDESTHHTGGGRMKMNILAVFGILVGLILIRGGLDSLVAWRAWFLFGTGLFLFIVGGLRVFIKIRRFWGKSTGQIE
jgi:hypothetical protein